MSDDDQRGITQTRTLDTCPLGPPACVTDPGDLVPVIATSTGRAGAQCPSCRRVWHTTAGDPWDVLPAGRLTWTWPTDDGGWRPASDPAADGWRRMARSWRLSVRVRLPRWSRGCGERWPRLRRL